MAEPIGIFIMGMVMLMMYSFMWKDNPFYKIAEALLIGTAAGYYAITGLRTLWYQSLTSLLQGNVFQIIPLALGAMMFATFIPKISWTTRIPITIIAISGLAVTAAGSVPSVFVAQPIATFTSLTDPTGIIILAGVLSIIAYFIFSIEHKGPVGSITRFGRLYLITGLGAAYAYFVTTRITRWVSSLTTYLFVYPAYYAIIPVVGLIVVWEFWTRSKKQG